MVEEEFGSDEYDAQMNKLLQLKQTGTVVDYRVAFEASMYHLLSLDATLNSKFFITRFLLGLKDEIRGAARMQAPTSITCAAVLSRIQEEELEATHPRHRKVSLLRAPATLPATVPAPTNGTARGEFRKSGGDEFWREQKLKEYRRTNSLCFKCGDKYSKEHTCKK